MNPPFVGGHRIEALERLLSDYRAVAEHRGPRVTFVQAPLGWGKTRLVHELYRELAASQERPYWPAAISTATPRNVNEVFKERKRLIPAPFHVPGDASPEWIWLGIATDPSLLARPEEAYMRIVAQLEPHIAPILRMRRLTKATVRTVLSLLGALLPVPTDIEALATLLDGTTDVVDAWRAGAANSRTVGTDTIDYTAQMRKLLTTVWGEDGRKGPPIVLLIEDAQFLSDQSADLLRVILASNLPILVIATGWELNGDERFAPFQAFVESAPSALRVENLLALDAHDAREIVDHLHPGTPSEVVDLLAQRFASNPYGLQVFLLNRDAQPGEAWDWADLDWLAEADSDLHTELRRLLEQSDRKSRLALMAAAILGYRIPESLGDDAARLQGADVGIEHALVSGWMRSDQLTEEFASFIEPIRHETARALAFSRTPPPTLALTYHNALFTLEKWLTGRAVDEDRALLAALYIDIATEQQRRSGAGTRTDRNDDLLAVCVTELLAEFWRQRAYRAGQSLIARIDQLVEPTRLDPVRAAELAVARAHYERRLVSPASAALDGLSRAAVKASKRVRRERPDLRIAALLERSILLSSKNDVHLHDIDAAERLYREATELAADTEHLSDDIHHRLRARRYGLMSARGERLEAYHLALEDAVLTETEFGPESDERSEALANAAFYIARVDPLAAIQPTRDVIDLQTRRWGTTRHPRVAIQEKDLAVRMLHSYRDELVPEALAMTERAHKLIQTSFGPQSRSTLNALSARSSARRRASYLQWRSGNVDVAAQLARLALVDAEELATGRQRLQSREAISILTKSRLAAARAATGDLSGLVSLRACIDERLNLGEKSDRAEVLWAVRDLHQELTRNGLLDDRDELRREFPHAFANPYPAE
ncbi:hypothetical protein ACFUTX_12145 [Microbacterium sp. NPDC057407]|uniref:hypothetical protein n=1 Tax=Microbacterium sp. NPDC057407 TaxID=3346120 RepID=UPI00366F3C9F